MQILIIGGTRFLGRALVDAARQRGHTLTLFNRGKSNPDLYPEIEQLHGDRDGDLSVLAGRRWQAVIDTCAYSPRQTVATAGLLAASVDQYTAVSSLSVYADTHLTGIDEAGAVGTIADETVEEITGETYGPLKVLCERAVEAALPGQSLIIRPGLIVGPHDPTDRFTYWPHRVAGGGEVLVPGDPGRGIQIIDVRDLAEWTVRLIEARQVGVFNAVGPAAPLPMAELLRISGKAAVCEATVTWVSEEFLLEQEVVPWSELPVWVPTTDAEHAGFFTFDVRKAIAAGLTFRSLEETVRATLDWAATRPAGHEWRAGLTRAREAELLAAWRQRCETTA